MKTPHTAPKDVPPLLLPSMTDIPPDAVAVASVAAATVPEMGVTRRWKRPTVVPQVRNAEHDPMSSLSVKWRLDVSSAGLTVVRSAGVRVRVRVG